jgi:hypothetical protein
VTRVIVELERREHPISGTVHSESEMERPFVGWIGLLAALDAAIGAEDQAAEDTYPGDARG